MSDRPAGGDPARTDRRSEDGIPTIAVVGGGIAGLAAAWELTGGTAGSAARSARVVLMESDATPGGKLRSIDLAGRTVDVGPDSFVGRRPEATALCREIGLGHELEPIASSGASVWTRGRLRQIPEGLALGVPTRFWPTARSGILGVRGSLRLLVDTVSPRPDRRNPLGDRAVGPLVSHKLGTRVVQSLVDPLVGGIHAGSVTDMSAAAVFPTLLVAAQRRGSFMRALRRSSEGTGVVGESAETSCGSGERTGTEDEPAFWSMRHGVASLAEGLAAELRRRGVQILTNCPVHTMARSPDQGERWIVHSAGGALDADGVVLAVPAAVAATIVAPHDHEAATLLRGIEYSSVTVVTLAYGARSVPAALRGTGFLVPASSRLERAKRDRARRTPGASVGRSSRSDDDAMVTACSYLWRKWPHLRSTDHDRGAPDEADGHSTHPGSEETVVLRASVGRFGDTRAESIDDLALVDRVTDEIETMTGITGRPLRWDVTRWPDAFPQYKVHHLLRVQAIESALGRLRPVAVAGAAYRGVGIPACIASGRRAARDVLGMITSASTRKQPSTREQQR